MCERWRVGAHLRIYRGHGLANFDFRLGFPRHSHNAVRMEKEMLELDL